MARKTTKRPRRPTDSMEPEGFPQWEHESSFTFEGEIERLGAISRKMSTSWVEAEGNFRRAERYTVAGRVLTGSGADLVISARGVAHVWTIDDPLVATVARGHQR